MGRDQDRDLWICLRDGDDGVKIVSSVGGRDNGTDVHHYPPLSLLSKTVRCLLKL